MTDGSADFGHAEGCATLSLQVRASLRKDDERPVEEWDQLARSIDALLTRTPTTARPKAWEVMAIGLRALASRKRCLALALANDDRLLAERTRSEVLLGELRACLRDSSLQTPECLDDARRELLDAPESHSDAITEFLARLPLPTIYRRKTDEFLPARKVADKHAVRAEPLIRLVVSLDNEPVMSPQLVQPQLLYPLQFRISGLDWPDTAERLRIDFLTTCPHTEYAISSFVLERPAARAPSFNGELKGHIRFNSAQSSAFEEIRREDGAGAPLVFYVVEEQRRTTR